MSKQILLFLLSCAFLSPGSAIAQMQAASTYYSGSSSYSMVSNFANCTGTAVCWHTMSASAGLNAAQVYAGNGHVLAINASGLGYIYNDYPTNTWTPHSEWGTVYELHYAGDGNLYGMTGSCGGTGHYISKWTGVAWQTVATCFHASFSPAADGSDMMVAVDINGAVWGATGFGSSGFTRYPVPNGLAALSAAAISVNPQSYVLVMSDHTIWTYTAGTWTQLPGLGLQVTADALGTLYVIGTDHYVYHWDGTAWGRLAGGSKTFLANGGTMEVFAVGALVSGNSVYRFSDQAIRHTRTVSGDALCYSCFPQTYHNSHVKANWAGKTLGGADYIKNDWDPNTPLSISSVADLYDPFTCLESDTVCAPTTAEDVFCTQAGNLESTSGPTNTGFKLHLATSRFLTDPARETLLGNNRTRYYMQGTWCSNTNFPDFDPSKLPGPPVQTYTFLSNRTGFDLSIMLMSLTGCTDHNCWLALPGQKTIYRADFLQPQNQIPIAPDCTVNGQP